jgi:ribose 5-phosphate isomerase A
MNPKEQVAQEIAKRVQNGQVIGVGTGSTVELVLSALSKRMSAEGLTVRAVTTSLQSAWKCQEAGVVVLDPGYRGELDWGFDGADAVDERRRAIKGKGGAMLREKLVAARCRKFVLAVDSSKLVSNIAAACPIPVEVIPEALALVERGLKRLGASSLTLRPAGGGKHGPVITEAGNLVLDAQFSEIDDALEGKLKQLLGVVESGLFVSYAHEVLVGTETGVRSV